MSQNDSCARGTNAWQTGPDLPLLAGTIRDHGRDCRPDQGLEGREPMTQEESFLAAVPELFALHGKVVFIPGGYGGIGRSIASALAVSGARVVVGGRRKKHVDQLVKELSGHGHSAGGVTVDAESVSSIRDAVDRVAGLYGRIDVLVNCIGIQREEPILQVTEEAFDEVYRTNLKAAMFLARETARHQIAAGNGGRQVHLLSVRSQLGLRERGYSAYCSTKGGLAMLVKQHAAELGPVGITVNGVAPTFVYTELIRYVVDDPEYHARLVSRIPLGRIADPLDVVGPVLFFCADASGFVTGQTLYVDGGVTATQ